MVRTGPLDRDDRRATCRTCGSEQSLDLADAMAAGMIRDCPCCGGDEFYLRRAFPQRLGLTIVVIVALASIYLFGTGNVMAALGVLGAIVVVDLAIYGLLPQVTTCYRCGAEFRGIPVNPAHGGFDLAVAEKYRSWPGTHGPGEGSG